MTAFIDDLLIYSRNQKEHEERVKIVLQRLREAALQASISKCEFNVTRTKYLSSDPRSQPYADVSREELLRLQRYV